MDLGLNGKKVVVTGGSKGIGLACADIFAAEGASVIMVARDAGTLGEAAVAVRAKRQVPVETLTVDLSRGDERTRLPRRFRMPTS